MVDGSPAIACREVRLHLRQGSKPDYPAEEIGKRARGIGLKACRGIDMIRTVLPGENCPARLVPGKDPVVRRIASAPPVIPFHVDAPGKIADVLRTRDEAENIAAGFIADPVTGHDRRRPPGHAGIFWRHRPRAFPGPQPDPLKKCRGEQGFFPIGKRGAQVYRLLCGEQGRDEIILFDPEHLGKRTGSHTGCSPGSS